MKTARPYRSHRYPACTRCHQRRSRCVIDVPGKPCSPCQMHGAMCSLARTGEKRASPRVGFIHRSLLADDQSLEYKVRVVGPVVARDTQILDQYIPQVIGQRNDMSIKAVLSERESQEPIYQVPLPSRIPSPVGCQCSKDVAQKFLAQVDPFLDKLMSNYFENIAPCYPITDEEYIMTRIKNRNTLPETFLVILVSHALCYWDLSPALSAYARPDQALAWRASVISNATNLHAGEMATISAICLGIAGRPFQRMVYNASNVARTVAVAHIIGLNHDSREWKSRELEKKLRWKVWWALLIQDRWFNFAQGTPTYIAKSQYDVPIPTMQLQLTPARANSVKHVRAAEVYIQLCRLTEILGDVLPLIYQIRTGANENVAARQVSQSEMELDQWIETQPSWLNLYEFHERPSVPGLVNLQLSYLSVRMLLRRIAWHEATRFQVESDPTTLWLSRCQTAAENMVHFLISLRKEDLRGFWLPYSAQHFTSAVTLLLRCALQTSDANSRANCMASARTLVDCLRRYQDEDKWDLADLCLVQSETVLTRIEKSLPRVTRVNASGTIPSVALTVVPSHDDVQDRTFVNDGMVNEISPGEAFNMLQAQATSLEELFPEVFGDWFGDSFTTGQDYYVFDD